MLGGGRKTLSEVAMETGFSVVVVTAVVNLLGSFFPIVDGKKNF